MAVQVVGVVLAGVECFLAGLPVLGLLLGVSALAWGVNALGGALAGAEARRLSQQIVARMTHAFDQAAAKVRDEGGL
jgi:hypothetical protein